jgi:hypothetical protein
MTEPSPLPDLGLPLYGLRTWMLGSRVLSFDVTPLGVLELRVEDRVLRRFPTGSVGDSAIQLSAAREDWVMLRPLARAAVQRARATLQESMSAKRAWTLTAFDKEVGAHPLMRRLASRLIWAGLDDTQRPVFYGRLMLHGAWDLGPGRSPDLPHSTTHIMLPRGTDLPEAVRRSWSARFPQQLLPQLSRPGTGNPPPSTTV